MRAKLNGASMGGGGLHKQITAFSEVFKGVCFYYGKDHKAIAKLDYFYQKVSLNPVE